MEWGRPNAWLLFRGAHRFAGWRRAVKRGPLSSSLPLVVARVVFSSSTALLLAVIVTCSFAENVPGEIDTLGAVQRKQRQSRKTKRHFPDDPQGHASNRPLHMVCLIAQMICSYRTCAEQGTRCPAYLHIFPLLSKSRRDSVSLSNNRADSTTCCSFGPYNLNLNEESAAEAVSS
jgi:hypothetical protein